MRAVLGIHVGLGGKDRALSPRPAYLVCVNNFAQLVVCFMFSNSSTLIGINSLSTYLSGRGTVGKQEGIGGEHAVLCCQSIPTIWVIMPVCILSWF